MKCLHISHGQFNILNVLRFLKLWMPFLVQLSWMNFILLILFIFTIYVRDLIGV